MKKKLCAMLLALGIVVTQMPGITISAEQLVNEQSESVEETLSFVSMNSFTEADAEAEEGQDEQTASPEKSTAENADEGDVKNTEEPDNDPEETEIAGSVETPAYGENVDGETPESGSAEIAEVMDEPLRASAENEEITVRIDANGGTLSGGATSTAFPRGTEVQVRATSRRVDIVNADSSKRENNIYPSLTPPANYQLSKIQVNGVTQENRSYSFTASEDVTVKLLWVPELSSAEITIHPPRAGESSSDVNTAGFVSVPDGAPYTATFMGWRQGLDYNAEWSGTFESGSTYYAKVRIQIKDDSDYVWGWGSPDEMKNGLTINDGSFSRDIAVGGDLSKYQEFNVSFNPAEASDKTVDMRVWTPGHGKVMVNGSDYGTEFRGTWDEGAEVQIEAVPDSGYRFDHWYFSKASGGSDRAATASTTVIAGTHTEAIAVFGLETASLTITAPSAGQTAATKPQISLPSGAGYSIESDSIWSPGLSWVESEAYSANVLDPATTFEEGKTYYAKVRLRDNGAGFSAVAGGSTFSTDLSVTGGEKKRQSNGAYTEAISESEYMAYIVIEAVIAVTVPKAAASHDLTFGFLNTGTSASLADLISSVTVNGSNWALTASGMRLTGQIPAGASVSVAMQATDNAGFFGIHPKDSVIPYPGDAVISQDSSRLTFSFTMPENDAVIEIVVSKTVIFTFDVNGGTKGPGWPGDSIRYPDLFAGMRDTWSVDVAGNDGSIYDITTDPSSPQVIATAPAGSKYTGIEITDKNGVHTGTPGQTIKGLDLSEGATVKFLWATNHTVTFDTDGLYETPASQTVADGEKATRPAAPAVDAHADNYEANGLNFRAWYSKPASEISSYWEFCYTPKSNDAGCIFDFDSPITADTTAYAVYEGVLTIQAYDVTKGLSRAGGSFDFNNYNSLSYGNASSVQTFAFCHMPEFLKAKPADGYEFVGWSTSTSKDDIISSNAEYTYTFTQRATLYALFEIPHEHEWGDPTYEWAVDNSAVTATRTCAIDASHVESETVDTTSRITKPATCVAKGETTYTATFANTAFTTQTRTVEDIAIDADAHVWDDGVITAEPTCTKAGVRTFTCANDATHTRTEDVDALGHDWSAWEVTKEPTETEDGEETRTCARCEESESRLIPHLVVEYRNTEGDGSSWEKGSTESLIFVFKRSIHDETTFSHFTGIQVDGETVDPDNYSAVSGSVVITLMPAYLETLSAGGHTLMALFDDADDVTVNFTVTEKKVAPSNDTDKTDTQKTNTTDTSKTAVQATDVKAPKTGDTSNTEVWAILLTVSFLSLILSLILRRRYSR